MRLLFVGDVVGRSGRAAVIQQAPLLRARWKLDFVIVNGENAAGGFGLTEAIFEEFLAAGRRRGDARQSRLRPARGAGLHRAPAAARPPRQLSAGHAGARRDDRRERQGRARCSVVNLLGRIFMDALDDPFAALDRELAACPLGAAATRSSSTSTPRRPARNRRSAISPTAGRASSSAPTPTCRAPTIASLPAAPASSPTSA